ncbi:MAG: hypothetical protein IIA09_19370 [Proteobacteria bacterium]|nr:hypothetical protein [Pseudomonadota bacterium]
MKNDTSIELPGSGTLTRRQMISLLVSVGVGVTANPLMSPLAAAAEIGNSTRMVAAIFFESYATIALRRALRYAGDDGFVASMPQLLHARVNADYDNIIWNTWFSANSEENVVATPQGSPVVVTIHGGGIFASPDRFERSLRADLSRYNSEGLTGQYAAKITEIEARDVLRGKLPDGTDIPIYPFAEFKRGISDLPMRYGVALDFVAAKNGKRGYESFAALMDDPNMIVRAGGAEPLAAYLDKAMARHDTQLMGNWHPYNWIDPKQPQARLLNLGGNKGGVGTEGKDQGLGWGYDSDDGVGTTWPGGFARYVAVAPRDESTSLSNLDFEL